MQVDPRWALVEDTFEQHRPPRMVSRRTCVFATDKPELIQSMVKGRPSSFVYRVEVPPHGHASGRFDMKLVDPAATGSTAAADYWSGRPNGNVAPRSEVLATELMVVSGLGPQFVAAVRKLPLWRDLSIIELQRGSVVL
jgi:hypothetical protein